MQFRTITLTSLFLFILWCGAAAQVTLTADNSTPPAGYTDSLYFGITTGLSAPLGGEAQVWDYSHVQQDFPRVVEISDEQENSFFPDAYIGSPAHLNFQAFEADAVVYIGADSEGLFNLGRLITETTYDLTAVTGNPDDTFVFVADTVTYEGRINELQFPMTYPDTYNGSRIERTHISLTVAAFGLVNAPVESRRYYSEERSVIGYGQVIIPLEDQSPSPPVDVLLIQVDRTTVDSFFIGGMVAPPTLTGAFGVSQGMTGGSQSFIFQTPGLEPPVVRINMGLGGEVDDMIYRPRAADLVSGTRDLSTTQLYIQPNPVQSGQTLLVQLDEGSEIGSLHLLSLNGQIISTPMVQGFGTQYQVQIPDAINPGLYLLHAYDQNGRLIRANKVVVQ